jgi:acetylglutamate kinase
MTDVDTPTPTAVIKLGGRALEDAALRAIFAAMGLPEARGLPVHGTP